jgi:hypothetical protein
MSSSAGEPKRRHHSGTGIGAELDVLAGVPACDAGAAASICIGSAVWRSAAGGVGRTKSGR